MTPLSPADAPPHGYTLYGPAFKADPYTVFADMRREGPVCPAMGVTGTNAVWFVTRYAEARAVLRDPERFVSDARNADTPAQRAHRPSPPLLERCLRSHLMKRDGADHARLRALLQPTFHRSAVERMRPRIQHLADTLLDAVQHRGRMDLVADFAFPLPFRVIVEIIGFPAVDLDRLRAWTDALILSPGAAPPPPERRPARAAFLAYLRTCVDARRAHPQGDLLTHLVRDGRDGRLDEEELFSTLTILLIAGHETTARMIGNGVLALLRHPEQIGRLRQRPELLEPFVEELLRYDGSVERATTRFAADDLDFGGRHIRRGDPIVVLLTSANRDERVFADADLLDPGRRALPHLSFGGGPHFCVGAALARLELRIALGTLLRRLPGLRLAVPAASLDWSPIPAIRGLRSLPVCWG